MSSSDASVLARARLQELANVLARDGITCSLKHDGSYLQIFQDDDRGYTYYEVVPWRASPRVPVLYFTRYEEDAEGVLRLTGPTALAQDPAVTKWISAAEHPFTALPSLFIHPCRTQEWLDATGGDWHLWLQHFGRGVGLRV